MSKSKKLRKLIKAAKMHKPYAMYQLGICYEIGYNVQQDICLAIEWISAAAWSGYAPAVAWMRDMNYDDNAEVQANA